MPRIEMGFQDNNFDSSPKKYSSIGNNLVALRGTYTVDDGRQQGGGNGDPDQGAGGTLEQGHGHASARCQGPQNAHPEGAHIAPANRKGNY